MLAPRYEFRSTWRVPAAPSTVYQTLHEVLRYPLWWPQFRDVMQIADGRYRMVVHSFLPYRINYVLSQEIADRATGRLEGTVEGDIEGRIGWKIDPSPTGAVVRFRERVETHLDLLNLLAPVARWAFELNHRVMMRDGMIGLRALVCDTDARSSRSRDGAEPRQ